MDMMTMQEALNRSAQEEFMDELMDLSKKTTAQNTHEAINYQEGFLVIRQGEAHVFSSLCRTPQTSRKATGLQSLVPGTRH